MSTSSGCRFSLVDMRFTWNGFLLVAVTSILLLLIHAPTGTGNPRRHGPATTTSSSVGRTSQCTPQCFGNVSSLELKRNYRLDSVKDDILRKLRMSEPPNVTIEIPDVPAMQTLLTQLQNDNNTTEHSSAASETDRVSPTTYILLSQMVPPHLNSQFTSTCYFTFSPDLLNDQLVSANLGIYLHLRNASSSHSPQSAALMTWLIISRIGRNPGGTFYTAMQRRRKIRMTPQDTGKWQLFDAKILVEYWKRNPGQNYGIAITAQDLRGNPIAVLPTANLSQDVLTPYIEVQVLRQPSSRQRRSTSNDCVEANADPRCCRYPLTIDFDVFRWDWILAPKRYEAYYCSGECPFLYRQRHTQAHLVNQLTGHLGVPCCAPTSMSSLQMIYINSENNIVHGQLPGMIVERCGCS